MFVNSAADNVRTFIARNYRTIASIVFQGVSVPVFLYIYRSDSRTSSSWLIHHPVYFALLAVTGAMASHGLSALVSIIFPADISGTYNEIQNSIFAASPWLVIIQTVVLAPVSEEILFRGIIFRRLEAFTDYFIVRALISSAIFGIYHMNLSQGIFAFAFGLLCCAVYYSMNSLWASIVLHAGGNLLSVIMVYTDFKYSSEIAYIAVMCACLAGAAVVYCFVLRPKRGR